MTGSKNADGFVWFSEPADIAALRRKVVPEIMPAIVLERGVLASNIIEVHHCRTLHVLSVVNASPHIDEDFQWTFLWVLQSDTHEFRMRGVRAPIPPGFMFAFNSERQHWTRFGSGVLACAAWTVSGPPSQQDFDGFLQDIRKAFS